MTRSQLKRIIEMEICKARAKKDPEKYERQRKASISHFKAMYPAEFKREEERKKSFENSEFGKAIARQKEHQMLLASLEEGKKYQNHHIPENSMKRKLKKKKKRNFE